MFMGPFYGVGDRDFLRNHRGTEDSEGGKWGFDELFRIAIVDEG
jgi:hypothetical protein